MENLKEYFQPKLEEIIILTERAMSKTEGYLSTTQEKPDIALELLTILNISDDLNELFNPSKTGGEYFGLPKEAVINAKDLTEIISGSGIDYTPWFGEKCSNIKLGVKNAIKYWSKNPSEVRLTDDAPMTVEEWIVDGLESGLHNTKTYAETILNLLVKD
ncbi:hypothetical protein [Bacillus sp. Au-Bac7]|uniref:hypothetical protein n=1 Tax=Bacillus sp. Au-Bac7 TaxID=2906458 RepID=UPI001E58126C|nr:hypothetical protein [Bacillus sp. Au-Bac7]MCE4051860.1 hypothetical protein [Bacillus sp. Au-Bac7]